MLVQTRWTLWSHQVLLHRQPKQHISSARVTPLRVLQRSKTTASSHMSSLKQPLAWYSRKLETHPLTTKCLTSGLVAGSGDCLSQYIVHVQRNTQNDIQTKSVSYSLLWWDRLRTVRFAGLGCFLVAPVIHVWYHFLVRTIPGTAASAVLKRVACDQLIFAPVFVPTWLCSLWTLEGKLRSDGGGVSFFRSQLSHQYMSTLVANWCLYVPTQMINFRFVPVPYQVLFSNMVGFVWSAILSFLTNREAY